MQNMVGINSRKKQTSFTIVFIVYDGCIETKQMLQIEQAAESCEAAHEYLYGFRTDIKPKSKDLPYLLFLNCFQSETLIFLQRRTGDRKFLAILFLVTLK